MDNEWNYKADSKYVVKYKDLSGEYFSSFINEACEAQKVFNYLMLREDKRRVALIDLEKGEVIKSFKISENSFRKAS